MRGSSSELSLHFDKRERDGSASHFTVGVVGLGMLALVLLGLVAGLIVTSMV